jgi:hypothetical protein
MMMRMAALDGTHSSLLLQRRIVAWFSLNDYSHSVTTMIAAIYNCIGAICIDLAPDE